MPTKLAMPTFGDLSRVLLERGNYNLMNVWIPDGPCYHDSKGVGKRSEVGTREGRWGSILWGSVLLWPLAVFILQFLPFMRWSNFFTIYSCSHDALSKSVGPVTTGVIALKLHTGIASSSVKVFLSGICFFTVTHKKPVVCFSGLLCCCYLYGNFLNFWSSFLHFPSTRVTSVCYNTHLYSTVIFFLNLRQGLPM